MLTNLKYDFSGENLHSISLQHTNFKHFTVTITALM